MHTVKRSEVPFVKHWVHQKMGVGLFLQGRLGKGGEWRLVTKQSRGQGTQSWTRSTILSLQPRTTQKELPSTLGTLAVLKTNKQKTKKPHVLCFAN